MKKRVFRGKKIIIIVIICIIAILTFLLSIYELYTPEIHLKGSKEIEIAYKDKYKEEGYYASIAGLDVSKRIQIKNNIDYDKIGTYEIEYKITNILGNSSNKKRIIKITDKDAPVIELLGSDIKIELGTKYNEPGYKSTDLYDGDITDKVKVEDNININKVGEYEVNYKVNDSSMNEATTKRKVIVYEKNIESIPILTYHNFMNEEEKNKYAKDDKYTMTNYAFEQHLKYLKDNNYKTITLDDFYLWYIGQKYLSKKDVVIVIDDGNISAYKYAIPLLEKYNLKATIFVITGRIKNEEQIWDPSQLKFFNNTIINDIRTNHKNITLASHTHYLHTKINDGCAMTSKNENEIYEDVKISKEIIKSDFIAYPYGCHTEATSKALKKANYKMGFEFGDNRRATKDNDIYGIKRININATTSKEMFIKWLEV